METKLSTKGQVVLPGPVRQKLGLKPGDILEVFEERGQIVLAQQNPRSAKAKVRTDAVTGLPVLDAGTEAPGITSKQVREILSNFP